MQRQYVGLYCQSQLPQYSHYYLLYKNNLICLIFCLLDVLLCDEDTGLRIRFDKGVIGKNGFRGQDHYHILNPNATSNKDLYLDENGNPVAKNSKKSHILPKGGKKR